MVIEQRYLDEADLAKIVGAAKSWIGRNAGGNAAEVAGGFGAARFMPEQAGVQGQAALPEAQPGGGEQARKLAQDRKGYRARLVLLISKLNGKTPNAQAMAEINELVALDKQAKAKIDALKSAGALTSEDLADKWSGFDQEAQDASALGSGGAAPKPPDSLEDAWDSF